MSAAGEQVGMELMVVILVVEEISGRFGTK